jgi:hypothetical protein
MAGATRVRAFTNHVGTGSACHGDHGYATGFGPAREVTRYVETRSIGETKVEQDQGRTVH